MHFEEADRLSEGLSSEDSFQNVVAGWLDIHAAPKCNATVISGTLAVCTHHALIGAGENRTDSDIKIIIGRAVLRLGSGQRRRLARNSMP